ncbi:MAG: ACT domain-containing protein [Acidobacteria bacterium]|nr:ACT domain-containing protein [Acidobacteriota bacterium]
MKIRQLSLFLQNEPGRLAEPCRFLADNGINIRTLTLADTQQFGILRMVVSDPDRAATLLKQADYLVKVTEVVAIEVPDTPGGLAEVLEVFENSGINIEYMYALTSGRQEKAVIVFRFDQPDAAIDRLAGAGISVLDCADVYQA